MCCMIETPHIVKTEPQLIAAIHITVPRAEIQLVMGPGLKELGAAVAKQNVEVTGPWFTHHLRRPSDTFDFEICLPVSLPVTPAARVYAGELPGMKVLRSVYQGGYQGLGAAWGEFDEWARANGHRVGEELWERYIVGPDISRDSADWRTELNRPLISA